MYIGLMIYVVILLQYTELRHYLPSQFCCKIIYCNKVCTLCLWFMIQLLQYKELLLYLSSQFCRKIIYCNKVCNVAIIVIHWIITYSFYLVSLWRFNYILTINSAKFSITHYIYTAQALNLECPFFDERIIHAIYVGRYAITWRMSLISTLLLKPNFCFS